MSKQSSFPELEVSTSTTFIDVTDGTTPKNRKIKVSNLISSQLSNPSNFKAAATSLVSDELEKRVSNIEFNKYKDDTSDVLKAKLDKVDHTFDKLTSHPTTVQGYGITDAYNTGNANRTDTDWTAKDFIGNKLKLGKSILEYDEENDAFKVNGSIYATGGISCCGTGPNIPSGGGGLIESVYNSTQLDGNYYDTKLTDTFNAFTISSIHKRVKNIEDTPASPILTFNTTGTGNVVTSVTRVGDIVTSDKGVEAWTKTNLNPSDYLKVNSIADWAKQPNKPSYGFNEIGNGSFSPSNYLPLSGGTMTGNININNTTAIVQNQIATSNYTSTLIWTRDNAGSEKYKPSIGQHNEGGDGSGSITILPYATNKSPWDGNVGLYIGRNILKLDGNNIWHAGNFNPANYISGNYPTGTNILTGADCNVYPLSKSGFYNIYRPLNSPFGSAASECTFGLISTVENAGSGSQIAISHYDSASRYDMYFRTYLAGVFQPWRKLWHDGNFNPANFLPLSGGTITDTLTVNNGITAPSIKLGSWEIVANGNSLSFKLNGVEKGTMTDSGFVSSGGITALN